MYWIEVQDLRNYSCCYKKGFRSYEEFKFVYAFIEKRYASDLYYIFTYIKD